MQTQHVFEHLKDRIVCLVTKTVKHFVQGQPSGAGGASTDDSDAASTGADWNLAALTRLAGQARERLAGGGSLADMQACLEPLHTLDTFMREAALASASHWYMILIEHVAGTGHMGTDFEHEGVGYRFHGYRWRRLHLVTGEIVVKAAYYTRVGGGPGIYPLDLILGVDDAGHTREASFLMAEFAARTDYPEAETLVARATGLRIDQNRLHRHIDALGRAARPLQKAPPESSDAPPPQARVVVETDALMAPMRFDPVGDDPEKARAGWHEAHVGVVGIPGPCEPREPAYRRKDRSPGHKRKSRADEHPDVKLFDQTYVATYEGRQGHLEQLYVEARRRGWTPQTQTALIGDGANWVHVDAGEFFPGAVHILDWHHAAEHLAAVRDLAYESKASQGAGWYARQETNLWEGNIEAVIRSILYLARTSRRKPAKELRKQARYFRKRTGMMNYPAYRKAGWPIGSGAVESACRHVVQERCKCSGMRWSTRGLQNLLAVRTTILNNGFNELWTAHARRTGKAA